MCLGSLQRLFINVRICQERQCPLEREGFVLKKEKEEMLIVRRQVIASVYKG